jgi:uncharacterized cupredoxin-like copper-binding protein
MWRIAVLICAAFALAGCGGGGSSESADTTTAASRSASQQTVTVSEKEFSLTPSSVDVDRAGTVSFTVKNDGQITHALEVEGNGVETETEEIQPGESATLTVELSRAGSYEMYCPIDGHEGNGMKGVVRVGGSSGSGGGGTTTDDDTTTEGTTTDDNGGSGY